MGGSGKTVESDETYIGRLEGQPKPYWGGTGHKNVVLTLADVITANTVEGFYSIFKRGRRWLRRYNARRKRA
jgi:hypothetical protein